MMLLKINRNQMYGCKWAKMRI